MDVLFDAEAAVREAVPAAVQLMLSNYVLLFSKYVWFRRA
jgi:hypothetical protein